MTGMAQRSIAAHHHSRASPPTVRPGPIVPVHRRLRARTIGTDRQEATAMAAAGKRAAVTRGGTARARDTPSVRRSDDGDDDRGPAQQTGGQRATEAEQRRCGNHIIGMGKFDHSSSPCAVLCHSDTALAQLVPNWRESCKCKIGKKDRFGYRVWCACMILRPNLFAGRCRCERFVNLRRCILPPMQRVMG